MARALPAIDPTLFVGVITTTNLNEVQEQPTMVGYHAQAAAVLRAVNTLLALADNESLTFLANTAQLAQRETQFTVQEHYVSQMRIFADLYYDERAKATAPNEHSPDAMIDTIKADQALNTKALSVRRSAVRRMDVMLRMTRPLPVSVLRALNAESVNGTFVVMRKKHVLVCKQKLERSTEFLRARERHPKMADHLLLPEFYISQMAQRDVSVAWLATRAEVLMLSDNRILSIGLTTATAQTPRYTTLASRVEAEVNATLAPHRHLVSEHSRHYLVRAALSSAALEMHKESLRAAREGAKRSAVDAMIRPGFIHLQGRAAALVTTMRTTLAERVAEACQVTLREAISALESNAGATLVQVSVTGRADLSRERKRVMLRDMLRAVQRWHTLRSALTFGVAPNKVRALLLMNEEAAHV